MTKDTFTVTVQEIAEQWGLDYAEAPGSSGKNRQLK